jgi:predicted GIY-YIG superfamily endonuclease
VDARLAQHRAGKGAKYTRGRGPLELVYREVCGSKAEALRRERAIKRMRREAKQALCGGWAQR